MKTLVNSLILCRPKQWLKNILVFAGLIFAREFLILNSIIQTVYGFIIFCSISSSIYILNDILDKEQDKLHPVKKYRPIASEKISVSLGWFLFFILSITGLYTSYILNYEFFICIISYFILTIFYNLILKNIVILDIIIIALGFVIRAVSGTYILEVKISPWLIICTFLLALLIGFGKRRNELTVLKNDSSKHRKNLKNYSIKILNYYILIVSGITILSYCLYTISKSHDNLKSTNQMLFTIPFVVYGIFRYIYLIIEKNQGGEPETLLYKDTNLLVTSILWAILSIIIIFNNPGLL